MKWFRFNLRYLTNPPWDTGISPPELIKFVESHPPGQALDLGAGTGTNMLALNQAGWDVVGIEYALIAVVTAKRKLKRAGYAPTIYLKSVTDLEFVNRKFDLILDIGCFHSLSNEEKDMYKENILHYLKKEGTFLMYAFINTSETGTGIRSEDVEFFKKNLSLKQRQDGFDRKTRPSVWLEFKNLI